MLSDTVPGAANIDVVPGRYLHYKGGVYEVLGTAHHTETDEAFVVYRSLPPSLYPSTLRVRPLTMFLATIEVDGQQVPRFQPIASSNEDRSAA
jgi:hypothetical protein